MAQQQSQVDGHLSKEGRSKWSAVGSTPFEFRHRLADHPLFSIARLAALSERVFERQDWRRYFHERDHRVPKDVLRRRLRDQILDIADTGRCLALHYVDELDSEYERLFDELITDLESLCGRPLRKLMAWSGMSVFLNTPACRSPYRFDHETNFLLQVSGRDGVMVTPRTDRMPTEEELESFYSNNQALADRENAENLESAQHTRFQLEPGTGVHHPPLAPHRFEKGADVSISLAIYYTLPEAEYRARIYQVNHCLRQMGFRPRPPGESLFLDSTKERLVRVFTVRNPATRDEMLYSGITRLTAPFRWLRKSCR
ncbi:hypothetical protein [Xylophilus sp. GOD-11R]|uniref:hypothetical protein n=1 Tax=Xylophilus sp. GOD-11R TaxID=3089814 RepID=UPI00298D2F47|nr:hypothetical protein [Xylophilus sp. GOD-11R]WPB55472.1 hypothetical protein R9X41_15130 [Xylophilus sp. GOD-11R]